MTRFSAYAANFELYPDAGKAFEHLSSLFGQLKRVEFEQWVKAPGVNSGQLVSDFDAKLAQALQAIGAEPWQFPLSEWPQKFDFAFAFAGRNVAVEIEKANCEKILRDILKCHMYLHAGADFAVVALPRNWPHKHGVVDLFAFGVQRFKECQTYGFGTPDKLGRILLVGFVQFDGQTNERMSARRGSGFMDAAGK